MKKISLSCRHQGIAPCPSQPFTEFTQARQIEYSHSHIITVDREVAAITQPEGILC